MSKNDICRLCLEPLPKNRRRFIFAKSFELTPQVIEITGIIPQENDSFSSYTCYGCYAKLTKLNKIDFDLKNKVNSLREEKHHMLSEFQRKVHYMCVSATTSQLDTSLTQQIKTESQDVNLREENHHMVSEFQREVNSVYVLANTTQLDTTSLTQQIKTESQDVDLRDENHHMVSEFQREENSMYVLANTTQLDTTSPRQQIKTESQDVDLMASTSQKSYEELIVHTPTPRKVKSKRTIPEKLFPTFRKRLSEHQLSPDKVQVSFRGIKDTRIRTRLIKDSSWKSVLKSIVRGDKLETLSKKLYNIPSLKGELQKCLLKDLSLECTNMCQVSKPSVLGNKRDVEFKLGAFANELRTEAPLLYSIMQTVIKHPSVFSQ